MTFSTQVSTTTGSAALPVTSHSHPETNSTLKSIFVGRDGLRAGWRLLIFLSISFVLLAAFVLIRAGGVQGFIEQQKKAAQVTITPLLMGGSEAIAFLIICFAALVMAKIEGRKFREYGLPIAQALGKDFWKGALWGFLAISGTLLAIFALHGFRITGLALHGAAIPSAMAAWGVACLLAGLFEEFLCRGYVQYTLASGIGFWPAALVVSGLFGLVHAFNPNETAVGAVSAGLFGILFCLFLRRRASLWIPVGFHAAWDWGQNFYGVADSGIQPFHNVLSSAFHGPTWLTGGTVGPEASIMTLISLLVVGLIFNYYHPDRPRD